MTIKPSRLATLHPLPLLGIFLSQMQNLKLFSCNSDGPVSQPVKVFLNGVSSFQNIYLPHKIADTQRLGEGTFNIIQLVLKILDGIRHTIDSREIPLVTGCQLNFELLTTVLWAWHLANVSFIL